ncbi:MAG: FimV/HubP family polar landmark protein [Lysobacterales bacterium]
MKRPLQLSLAIALALGGTNALALGLGPVHVKSKLNQPLDAEIPVIQGSAAEAEGLIVSMAGAEDFERLGLSRARLTVPLEFALTKGAHGDMVIRVTSKEPVRDSYLDFLVEANWPKGRLLREYTVLLDPPVMAPSTHAATTAAIAPSPGTTTLTHREKPAKAAAAAPAPRPEPAPRVAAKPERAAPARKVNAGEYGPVEAGETLTEVARTMRQGDNSNINQMMLALLKNNPSAFYKDNINALKRGAILRVPSADELKATGSAREAAAQVHAQLEDWRGGRASPTLVADSGAAKAGRSEKAAKTEPAAPAVAKPKATASAARSGNEHLELVPPKAGRDSIAMADRPGSGAGSPAATSELKSELARTKEALTTRDQETGELKSRLKELEDLKNKNDRLIGLKDSEIAELQQKLKQLQEKPAAVAAAKPAATPAAAVPSLVAAKGAAPAAALPPTVMTTPSTAKPAEPAVPPPPASTSTSPAAVSSSMKPVVPTSAETKIDKKDIWGSAGTDTAKLADAGKTEPAPGMAPLPASGPSGAAATTIPLASVPPTSDAAHLPVTAPKPVTTAPVKPAGKTTPQRPVDSEPWYLQGWVKSTALVAGILLLLAGLFGMRKRKAAPVARGSIADAFGESPLTGGSGDGVHAAGSMEGEEAELREHLQHDPGNVGLHLELLSVYYAERDVARFEDAAAEMHLHVTDPHQPEWLEAQAMGQELAPGNPLFAGGAHYDDSDATSAAAHADTVERPVYTGRADGFAHAAQDESDPARTGPGFTFDTAGGESAYATHAPASPAHETGFDFDDLPPLEPGRPAPGATAAAAVPPPARVDDDYFAGDDAIGTKLDLAKAYMDMGDPEGARSMLEEVVSEGNEAQKAEAHKLIADLR